MLKDETNEKLQDVAFDIEQAIKDIGENPSSYDLGKFEGKMIGLSIMLNAVACEIERYCQSENNESKMEWIPYEGGKLSGPCVCTNASGSVWVHEATYQYLNGFATHYLMLPELPEQKENEDAKS